MHKMETMETRTLCVSSVALKATEQEHVDGRHGAVIVKVTPTVMPLVDVKEKQDGARKVADESSNRSATAAASADYTFRIKDADIGVQQQPARSIKEKGLMVDTGASSHIVTDVTKFKSFDDTFKPETHFMELADSTLCSGVAQRKENAELFLIDSTGQRYRATLRDALFIPSYPKTFSR